MGDARMPQRTKPAVGTKRPHRAGRLVTWLPVAPGPSRRRRRRRHQSTRAARVAQGVDRRLLPGAVQFESGTARAGARCRSPQSDFKFELDRPASRAVRHGGRRRDRPDPVPDGSHWRPRSRSARGAHRRRHRGLDWTCGLVRPEVAGRTESQHGIQGWHRGRSHRDRRASRARLLWRRRVRGIFVKKREGRAAARPGAGQGNLPAHSCRSQLLGRAQQPRMPGRARQGHGAV